jgi:environmental stress-induced protein Ves
MRIIRAAECRKMPWKNGGGETTEIIVSPAGATVDDFDWRVSMARVEGSGPFSLFPGVDRTLAILDGKGLNLYVEGRIPFGLFADSEPLSFPADVATRAGLFSGPITDLNVMTRRSAFDHSVTKLVLDGSEKLEVEQTETLVFCASGAIRLASGSRETALGPRDTVYFQGSRGLVGLTSTARTVLYLIEIWPLRP